MYNREVEGNLYKNLYIDFEPFSQIKILKFRPTFVFSPTIVLSENLIWAWTLTGLF